jgi:hypothetical protein
MYERNQAKVFLRGIAVPFVLLAVLLLAAGRLSYWQG